MHRQQASVVLSLSFRLFSLFLPPLPLPLPNSVPLPHSLSQEKRTHALTTKKGRISHFLFVPFIQTLNYSLSFLFSQLLSHTRLWRRPPHFPCRLRQTDQRLQKRTSRRLDDERFKRVLEVNKSSSSSRLLSTTTTTSCLQLPSSPCFCPIHCVTLSSMLLALLVLQSFHDVACRSNATKCRRKEREGDKEGESEESERNQLKNPTPFASVLCSCCRCC